MTAHNQMCSPRFTWIFYQRSKEIMTVQLLAFSASTTTALIQKPLGTSSDSVWLTSSLPFNVNILHRKYWEERPSAWSEANKGCSFSLAFFFFLSFHSLLSHTWIPPLLLSILSDIILLTHSVFSSSGIERIKHSVDFSLWYCVSLFVCFHKL